MLQAAPHRGIPGATIRQGNVLIGVSTTDGGWSSIGQSANWVAAIHGPIDNAAELGDHQPHLGVATSLAGLFARFGLKALDQLRGAFAGIVTDGERLFCFRDHLGSRPLFYRATSEHAWVATEAKQVVAGAGLRSEPDLDAIQQMFYRGTSEDSALKGVSRVFPSECVTLDRNGSALSHRYWNPDELLESRSATTSEAVVLLRKEIDAAVKRCLSGADAVALSGGIDSTMIAAFAAPEHMRLSGAPLLAYTAVYPRHPSVDEWPYTREVGAYLGIEVTPYEPSSGSLDNVERWVALADGPWDSTPMAVLFQGLNLASTLGARQVLMGTLAEYVFTINRFLLGHLFLRGRWKGLSAMWASRRKNGRSFPSLAKQLVREVTPAPLARMYARAARRQSSFYPPWLAPSTLGSRKYWTPLNDPARERWTLPTLSATRAMSSTQEAVEICSSVAGVTVRQPLADRDLWEFFLSLPVESKFVDPTPKAILREAMRGRLPDSILDRRDKTVFDEYVLESTPWTRLADLIGKGNYQMPGINYDLLRDRILSRSARAGELVWAHNLAIVHAFIQRFE
jgi:asparagine synthase (glutamine-hydrolysing)